MRSGAGVRRNADERINARSATHMQHHNAASGAIMYANAPQVLLPYPGCGNSDEQDIFLLLRPEMNNYRVEQIIVSTFRESAAYKKTIFIQYLANVSGAFIEKSKLFHKHYATKLFFAKHNQDFFSGDMKHAFEQHFQRPTDECEILGAFAASKRLGLSFEQLFATAVPARDTLRVSGQVIKRIPDAAQRSVYVVNPDIPALLSRQYHNENCAVVMFRTTLSYEAFNYYMRKAYEKLVLARVIPHVEGEDYDTRLKKVFRYSRSPFEQLRDSMEFLYYPDGARVSISDMTFARYLHNKGISYETMTNLLLFPVGNFCPKDKPHTTQESTIFDRTKYSTYDHAYELLQSLRAQRLTQ